MRRKHLRKPLTRAAAALTLACMLSATALPALAEGTSAPDAAPAVSADAPADPTTQEILLDDAITAGAGETKEMNGNYTFTKFGGEVKATDGGSITVNGNISTKDFGAHATKGGTITINGNIFRSKDSTTGTRAAIATGGGTVTVNGDIIDSGKSTSGAEAYDPNSKVVVTGNVTTRAWIQPSIGAAFAFDSGTVEIGGNVTNVNSGENGSYSTGASALTGGTLSIGGDVKANAIGAVANNGRITIKGNVEAPDTALYLGEKDSSILVGGDISSPDKKVVVNAAYSTNSGSSVNEIAIGGKIKNAGNSEGAALNVATKADGSVDESNLPEFVIGEIEDFQKISVTNSKGDALSDADQRKVLDNVKYIVRYADKSEDGQAALTVTKNDGSAFEKDSSGTYEVAKKGEEIKVKVETIPGWVAKILPGKDNTVRENGDGTYTVTVADGGGINIRAVLSQIGAPDPVTPSSSEGENTLAPWLYVVDKDGSRVPYTQELKDGMMVFTTDVETAALTGNLLSLKALGVNTARFVTPHKTSTFTVSTVCSAGSEGDAFVLAHDGANALLVANGSVHSDYLS